MMKVWVFYATTVVFVCRSWLWSESVICDSCRSVDRFCLGEANVVGIQMPNKYVYWAELLLIQVMVPNASFAGHLRYVTLCLGKYTKSFLL